MTFPPVGSELARILLPASTLSAAAVDHVISGRRGCEKKKNCSTASCRRPDPVPSGVLRDQAGIKPVAVEPAHESPDPTITGMPR